MTEEGFRTDIYGRLLIRLMEAKYRDLVPECRVYLQRYEYSFIPSELLLICDFIVGTEHVRLSCIIVEELIQNPVEAALTRLVDMILVQLDTYIKENKNTIDYDTESFAFISKKWSRAYAV